VRIAAVEALDIHALIRLAWLDVVRRHAIFGAPLDEGLRRELGAVVDAHSRGPPCSALVDVSPYSFTTLEELAERVGFEPDSFLWIP
jgi:hypothetical protein